MISNRNKFWSDVRYLIAFSIVIFSIFGLNGCDTSSLLDVKVTTKVSADVLDDPAFAEIMVLGAQADFECYYSNYVAGSGSFTDELYTSTEFFGYNQFNARQITPAQSNTTDCVDDNAHAIHLPLHRAIFTNDQAVRKIEGFPDSEVSNKNNLIAQASAYAGYALILQGEGYKRGVAQENGPALTPKELLAEAEKRFDKTLNIATDTDLINMARVGRARARLGQGNLEGAVTDAQKVPKGYVKYATYSQATANRENQVNVDMVRNQYLSIEPALRELQMLDGVRDPRVQFTDLEKIGPDGSTPLWIDNRYTEPGSPILLANWEEAQLIIAEARGGQEAVDRINVLRDQHGLPHFNSTDEDEIRKQVIEERWRELHNTGHRLGDKRRLNLEWQQGTNHKGTLDFGDQYSFPLAQTEISQNDNISN